MAFRLFLAFFAVTWLTIGFGIIDFASGFASPGETGPDDIAVLSAAYGAVAAIVLPAAFLAQLWAPQRRLAALYQLGVAGVAFTFAGVVGLDPLSFVSVAMLVVMLAVLVYLHPARPPLLPGMHRMHRPTLGLTAAAAAPWLFYAFTMAANSRRGLPPEESALRPQAGGWAGATAMALCVILLALLAATRTPGWRIPLWSAALTSFAFGVASLLHPDSPGSAGPLWGALAAAWSVAFIVTAELGHAATIRSRRGAISSPNELTGDSAAAAQRRRTRRGQH